MFSAGRHTAHAWVTAIFMAAAVVLGGGGYPNPATEIILALLAVAAALAWLWLVPAATGAATRTPALWALAILAIAVPLLQLIPVPPGLWASLPGQQDRAAALVLVSRQNHWQPLSLAPLRTLAALLAVVPPVLAMVFVARLDRRGRRLAVGAVGATALAGALLGAVQLSLGSAAPRLYAASNTQVTGFQANHNAAADVMLIGLLSAAATLVPMLRANAAAGRAGRVAAPGTERSLIWLMLAVATLIFLFATVFTASRAGIALIVLALVAIWAMLAPHLPAGRARWWPLVGIGAIVIAGAALAGLAGNTALGQVLARFNAVDDARRELWHDGWFAIQRSWPMGIGMGGAENALAAAERLEVVDPSAPNRVHNDYLEFLLEGGVAAVAVFLAAAGIVATRARRAWRDRGANACEVILGIAILTVLALHSLVDYPMRSMALACLAGFGTGLLFPAADTAREPRAPLDRRELGSLQ